MGQTLGLTTTGVVNRQQQQQLQHQQATVESQHHCRQVHSSAATTVNDADEPMEVNLSENNYLLEDQNQNQSNSSSSGSEENSNESVAYLRQEIDDPRTAIVQQQITGNEAKMLVILENGDSRMITFEVPKQDCTVQDLLEQVAIMWRASATKANIVSPHEPRVSLVSDPTLGINYIVDLKKIIHFEEEKPTENVSTEMRTFSTAGQIKTTINNDSSSPQGMILANSLGVSKINENHTFDKDLKNRKDMFEKTSAKLKQQESDIKIISDLVTSQQNEIDELKERLETKEKENDLLQKLTQELVRERRNLHNTILELKGHRVFCRVRPKILKEKFKSTYAINYLDEYTLEIGKSKGDNSKMRAQRQKFTFDKVFPPNSSQEEIFEELSMHVQSALEGCNVCVFAYGQTGSGKTYTMEGVPGTEEEGMIPKTVKHIFKEIKHFELLGWEYKIEASFLEIYNEQIVDLLDNNKKSHEITMANSNGHDLHVSNRLEDHNQSNSSSSGSEENSNESVAYLRQEIDDPRTAIVQQQITGNEAKMLVILENGDSRMITFEVPKEDCTVQDLLDQANILSPHEPRVSLVSDPTLGINYIVDLTKITPYEEEKPTEMSTFSTAGQIKTTMADSKGHDSDVSNLVIQEVHSPEDFNQCLLIAQQNRAMAATQSNERSSRSHTVARIRLIGTHKLEQKMSIGNLNLVDLASSERLKIEEAAKIAETKNINKSLTNLDHVILALFSKNEHMTYRNSKLTHLLMPSLGGNSKTLLLLNISPLKESYNETLNSLRFGSNVNTCKTSTIKKEKTVL